jgi:hypothetical protein
MTQEYFLNGTTVVENMIQEYFLMEQHWSNI